jgi:NAD+ synthase
VKERTFSIPPINVSHTIKIIEDFIKTRVTEAGAKGVVIGISGGIDSSVAACLAVSALGPEKVLGLFLPSSTTSDDDLQDVEIISSQLKIKCNIINIQQLLDTFADISKEEKDPSRLDWMNLQPRIRQACWYFYANKLNYLVCGGGNKSELMIGYYTKYGDSAVDIMPLGDVYKTHIYQLAEYLDIPQRIIRKVPSAGLSVGQTDEDEIGMSYSKLDAILFGLERFQRSDDIAKYLKISLSDVKKVQSRIYRSEHKRRGPILIKLGIRTPKFDWRIPLVEPSDY